MTKARDLANAGTALTTVSATELGYLDGVTSAVQTQIDAKLATSTASSTYIPKTLTTTTGDIIYASGANTPARLGIGSTDQVLKVTGGVPVWATPAGGGKVLQVVNATYNTSTSSSTDTFIDSGLTATITPTASTSKILVLSNLAYGRTISAAMKTRLVRGSTTIASGTLFNMYTNSSFTFVGGTTSLDYLDSPATTSATTYKVQFASTFSDPSVQAQAYDGYSSITLIEIGA